VAQKVDWKANQKSSTLLRPSAADGLLKKDSIPIFIPYYLTKKIRV